MRDLGPEVREERPASRTSGSTSGWDVFNLFNSDAATGYESDYTAFRLPDGTWVADNPAAPDVEVQDWGRVSNVLTPRHMKLSVTFNF